mmetsp:Transcript_13029/g.20226  ORF Transcript_13029/g.20226 Transcript_13029/m.20226 type:complete len:81 (+) Transcript_13029:549-791(+)
MKDTSDFTEKYKNKVALYQDIFRLEVITCTLGIDRESSLMNHVLYLHILSSFKRHQNISDCRCHSPNGCSSLKDLLMMDK